MVCGRAIAMTRSAALRRRRPSVEGQNESTATGRDGHLARGQKQAGPPTHPESGRISVLIAEDHGVVREGTRRILEQATDLEVVGEAADGQAAIDLVAELHPDVAIVDIAMPHVNGVEATRRIKERQPETSVLVLTAYDDDQYVFALLEAGAAGYLLKDVSGSELVRAIRAINAGEPVLHPAIERKMLRHFGRQSTTGSPGGRLSDRELEVLRLAIRGLSNKEIGAVLGVSMRTVQAHFTHIFTKLNVASRTEAVVFGLRQGWLHLEEADGSDD